MTTLVWILLLAGLAAAWAVRPLWSPRFDEPPGPGREGTTDPEGAPGASRTPGRYPVAAMAGFGATAVLTVLVALQLNTLDLRRTAELATARAGTETGATAAPAPPLDAEGNPDIGAMVGRLEARIMAGDAVPEDLDMLGRSYAILGRSDEEIGFLRRAADANPGQSLLLVALGVRLFEQGGEAADREAEAVLDRASAIGPPLPVVLLVRSVLLERRGAVAEAVATLETLQPMIEGDPAAAAAVARLLTELRARLGG